MEKKLTAAAYKDALVFLLLHGAQATGERAMLAHRIPRPAWKPAMPVGQAVTSLSWRPATRAASD